VLPGNPWLALAIGPLAYVRSGLVRPAWVAGGIYVLVLGLIAYVPYLSIYAEVTGGGDSARELTDAAIAATRGLWAAWRWWLPWEVVALALGNLACALDLARRARR
jgi:hypothetical protein